MKPAKNIAIGSAAWNNVMYSRHPSPYHHKLAGIIEKARVFAIKRLAKINDSDVVLEIGCEQGHLLSSLPKTQTMIGVDISDLALKDAFKRLGDKAKLIHANAEQKLTLPIESADVIICSQTLEHVKEPEKIMQNIHQLSKSSSRIVISVPDEVFLQKLKRMLISFYPFKILLSGIENGQSEWHLQVFTDKKVRDLVEKDFEVVSFKKVFKIYLVYLLKKRE